MCEQIMGDAKKDDANSIGLWWCTQYYQCHFLDTVSDKPIHVLNYGNAEMYTCQNDGATSASK